MSLTSQYHATALFEGDGTNTTWQFNFSGAKPASTELPYLSTGDIKAYTFPDAPEVTLTPVSFTWASPTSIVINPPVPLGTRLMIRRETSAQYNLTDYRDFNGGLTEADLEQSQRQLMMLIQEASDHSLFAKGTGDVVVISPIGVNGLSYDNESGTLTLSTVDGNEFTTGIAPQPGAVGYVGVYNVEPQYEADNVLFTTDDDGIVDNILSSTHDLRVHVRATTGTSTWKPVVTVNGTAVTNLSRISLSAVWEGYADVTVTGSTIVVANSQSGNASVPISYDEAPVVTSAVFIGTVYTEVGQTELPAGWPVQITVNASVLGPQMQAVRLVAGGATIAEEFLFALTHSTTISTTIADHGAVSNTKPIKLQVQNGNGTWSDVVLSTAFAPAEDGVTTAVLNNLQPVITFGAITYPGAQQAIKATEYADVAYTLSNTDTSAVSSPTSELNCVFYSGTVIRALRDAGTYNISTNNVRVEATRTANATTVAAETVVFIANDVPTLTIVVPNSSRVRSSVAGLAHSVTVTNSGGQRLLTPGLTASSGTLSALATADSGVTYTGTLTVADAASRGAQTFSGSTFTTLAGVAVPTIGSGAGYTIAGFTLRTITMAAYPNRKAAIGVAVADASKLRVSNLSKGASGSLNASYSAGVADVVNEITVVDAGGTFDANGSYLYNKDLPNAISNSLGTAQFEVEEVV